MTIVSWTLQIIAAAILAQTLFFKFTGAEESRYIFRTIGMEPWGRFAIATVEVVTVVLLLTPRTAAIGSVCGVGVISGALFFHLTRLGIEVKGDGGLLFGLACAVFVCCAVVALIRRSELPMVGPMLARVGAAATGA